MTHNDPTVFSCPVSPGQSPVLAPRGNRVAEILSTTRGEMNDRFALLQNHNFAREVGACYIARAT